MKMVILFEIGVSLLISTVNKMNEFFVYIILNKIKGRTRRNE